MFLIFIQRMPKKKFKQTYKPYALPSDFSEMEKFIEQNKLMMTQQVISSIAHAVEKNLDIIEVFTFKNSDFVITLSQDSFKQNLENVYNYYIATENYELCAKIKLLEKKLRTVTYKLNINENQ